MVFQHAPRESVLGRSVAGPLGDWSVEAYLLAIVADGINAGNWQRGGGKGPKPQRIERPQEKRAQSFGSDPIRIADFNDWWDGE